MSNPKFKRYDTVVPTGSTLHPVRTVRTCSPCTVTFYGDTRAYNPNHFELVQGTPEQPVLTPQEVFTAILEGIPLEYRTSSGSNWHTLAYPENTSMSSFKVAEFRKQVQTVNLSGTVPKPVPHDAIEITDKVYTVYLSTMQVSVVNGRYAQAGGLYWRTQEEAEQFRDALTKCFSTVPVLD